MPARLLMGLLFLLLIPCWVIAVHGFGDLPMYYAVAQYAANGEFSRVYASNAGVGHFFYAPLSLVLFSWMPALSYPTVKFLWVVLNTLSYVLFWWGLLKLYPFLKERRAVWFFVFVWIVSMKSIHASFQTHNVQLIIAAGLVLAEFWALSGERQKEFWAGALTSLLGVVKIYPFFFSLYYLITGKNTHRAGVILGGVVFAFLPFLWFGFETALTLYKDFYQNIFNFHDYAPLTKDAVTLSLASLMATWFSPSWGMEASLLANKVLTLVLVVGYFVSLHRQRGVHIWALGLALMALVNTSTRPDYFIFFVPAFASASQYILERHYQVWQLAALITAFAFLCLITEWTLGSRELGHALELLRLPVVGMILLIAALAFFVFSRKKTLHETP